MFLSIVFVVIGLAILIAGAEGLVRGASSLAAKLRISALVIGLTVVSFGTSAPELTVNILAAISGSPDLAIGNVLGSNIANILLVLGVTAVIVPLTVKSTTIWKEIPLALLGVVLLLALVNDRLLDGTAQDALTRTDGIALLGLMAIFLYYVFNLTKAERSRTRSKVVKQELADVENIRPYSMPVSIGLTVAGLVGLVLGGRLLVEGAVSIAETAGLSEALIGITVIGIGTSLPELATSVVAALKKQADIAIGNIIGSNIFNVFWILGLTSVISPLPFNSELNIDLLVGIAATLLLFTYMFVGGKRRLIRWEGISFLVMYAAYLVFLVLRG